MLEPMNSPLELRLLARLRVPIEASIVAGAVAGGERRIIPIGAGTVSGPVLFGEVLPLGADWNLRRPDGTETVSARYLLRLTDGTVLSVRNEGVLTPGPGGPEGITALQIEAPVGSPWAWLNDAVLVGSLAVIFDGEAVAGVSLEYWITHRRGEEPRE